METSSTSHNLLPLLQIDISSHSTLHSSDLRGHRPLYPRILESIPVTSHPAHQQFRNLDVEPCFEPGF
uniref:Uncharacterized protein n=1 Tax=Arundo donax TaxID=35708 RepID=A0A0A9ANX3_ARUDO